MAAGELATRTSPNTQGGRTKQVHQILLALILAFHAGLLGHGAWVHSPTLNERGHLAAGLFSLKLWRFDLYMVDPPLPRMIAALPVLAVGARTDWQKFSVDPASAAGVIDWRRFCGSQSGPNILAVHNRSLDVHPIQLTRRLHLFSLGEGVVWASGWTPRFGPMVLFSEYHCTWAINHARYSSYGDGDHGRLHILAVATKSDMVADWASGFTLGIAELTKTTLILLFPLWLIIWIVYRWSDRNGIKSRTCLRQLGMLGCNFIVAIYLLNVGYGFEGTGTRLGDFQFVSSLLSGHAVDKKLPVIPGNLFAGSWIGELHVPWPKSYVQGIDEQMHDFEWHPTPSFLNGAFHERDGGSTTYMR